MITLYGARKWIQARTHSYSTFGEDLLRVEAIEITSFQNRW